MALVHHKSGRKVVNCMAKSGSLHGKMHQNPPFIISPFKKNLNLTITDPTRTPEIRGFDHK